jgi:iron complex outermembrane receptor protein
VTPFDTLQLQAEVDLVQIEFLNNSALRPLGTPETQYRLAGDWEFLPKVHLRADAQHESARYSTSSGSRIAGSFNLVNAFLRYEPFQTFGLEIGVRNAGDELYAYEEGFYEPGRTFLAQVDFRLE